MHNARRIGSPGVALLFSNYKRTVMEWGLEHTATATAAHSTAESATEATAGTTDAAATEATLSPLLLALLTGCRVEGEDLSDPREERYR